MKKAIVRLLCYTIAFLFIGVALGCANREESKEETQIVDEEMIIIYVEESSTEAAWLNPLATLSPEITPEMIEEMILNEEGPIFYPEESSEESAPTTTESATEPETTIVETTTADNKIYMGEWRVTFYCNCSKCCGQWAGGPTASGKYPQSDHTAACGSDIPFGTVLYVKGLGTYICEDRGVPNDCIDIYVDSHSDIPSWGMAYKKVYIIDD